MAAAECGHLAPAETMVVDVESKPSRPHWYEQYLQPCVAELLGSAIFVLVGCLSVIMEELGAGILQPALVHGLAIALLVAILAEVSGGHLNPAASLTVWLMGDLSITMVIPYWVSQLCGGMIGAGLAKAVVEDELFAKSFGGAFTTITNDNKMRLALGGEIILTTFLLVVVCMAAINGKTKTPLAALYIGLTVTVNILAGGRVSGSCMNPARAFGPAVVANYWDYHWVYWVGPIVGALLASVLMRLLMGDRTTRLLLK